jgi:hypothetical protein
LISQSRGLGDVYKRQPLKDGTYLRCCGKHYREINQ